MTDPTRISDDQHNNAPAAPQGWKLVKTPITEEMHVAAAKVLHRAPGLAGLPQRMLDAMLAATPAPAPAQEVSDKHEREMLEVIDERDRIHEWADQLADAIAKHTGYEIGEHTSANNPWRMALNALVCHEAKQEVGLTDEQKTWAVNKLMEQAQVFASAWSLVGGKLDFGNALDEAEQAKTELRSMVIAALRAKGGK